MRFTKGILKWIEHNDPINIFCGKSSNRYLFINIKDMTLKHNKVKVIGKKV